MINIDKLRQAAQNIQDGTKPPPSQNIIDICMAAINALPRGNHNDFPFPWEVQNGPIIVIEEKIKEKVIETIDDKYSKITKIENRNERLRAIMDLYFYGK